MAFGAMGFKMQIKPFNTLGEQQKYVIAALEEVASMVPPEATITQCYDVACATDPSVNLVCILLFKL
jgi:hypothetical protein